MFPRNQSPRRRVMHENSELTNHDCFANVFRERGFRKFSTAQTGKLLQEKYPNFSLGSILPNDHAKGNAASCWCVGTPQQIFNKVRPRILPCSALSAFRIEAVPGEAQRQTDQLEKKA